MGSCVRLVLETWIAESKSSALSFIFSLTSNLPLQATSKSSATIKVLIYPINLTLSLFFWVLRYQFFFESNNSCA